MCRSIINFFLGVITVALLVVSITLSSAYFNFTNPDFHKQNILDSGFYNFTADRVEKFIATSAFPATIGTTLVDDLLEGTTDLIIQEFSASRLQLVVETNINNFANYFYGKTPTMAVYFPVSRARELVKDTYEQIKLNLSKIVEERPLCEGDQQPDERLSCITPKMREDGYEKLLPEEYSSEEKLMASFAQTFPLLASNTDDFTIQELDAALKLPGDRTDAFLDDLARSKELYDTSRLVVVCVWAINAAFILLFVLTLPKGTRAKVSKIAFWLILIGLGVFVCGIVSALLSTWLIENTFVQNNFNDYFTGMDNVVKAFISITLSRFYQQVIFIGVGALLTGVVLFMLVSLTRRKSNQVQVVVNEPTPITV